MLLHLALLPSPMCTEMQPSELSAMASRASSYGASRTFVFVELPAAPMLHADAIARALSAQRCRPVHTGDSEAKRISVFPAWPSGGSGTFDCPPCRK